MPARPTLTAADTDTAGEPFDQSELLDLVGYNIRRAYLVVQADFEASMAKLELRQAEFGVLSSLRGNPGVNQKALADALALAPPNLAILLDRLEARGLVVRQRSTDDKRVQLVSLTPQGVRLHARALKAAAAADAQSIGALSPAEAEQLKTLLRKMFVRRDG